MGVPVATVEESIGRKYQVDFAPYAAHCGRNEIIAFVTHGARREIVRNSWRPKK